MKSFLEMHGAEECQNSENRSITQAIWNLFSDGMSCPSENDFKTLGRAIEINHEILEQIAFELLHSFVAFGESNSRPILIDDQYIMQLEKGTNMEYEHTHSRLVAQKIAKDHLTEIPDYYDRLERMETAAKIELNLVGDENTPSEPVDSPEKY